MRPPNILWIVTTQWRAQACGYAGDPNAQTPCLDELAQQSINYRQAVTPHPFGPFARAALLTGELSPENGVRDYFDPLPSGARTIAHDLRERGYSTAFFGKWHLGRRDPAAPLVGEAHAKTIIPPEGRGGFEFWEGFDSGFLLNDPWLHGSQLPEPVRFEGYQPSVLARQAELWRLRGGGEPEPWFCVVSFETPHPPYEAEIEASGVEPMKAADVILRSNVPRGGEAETRARRELAGYYKHITATDQCIGGLLGKLRCNREGENTAVIVTSVHGDMHGAHGLFRKGWPHEESVRVPLLVRLPSREGAGTISDAAVSLVDLPRLTLDLAAGISPRSSREHALISMPSVVALPHQCDRAWRGVRTKTRKFVRSADGAPWLLFDLERDPLEMQNLVADPARASEVSTLAALTG